MRNVSRGVAAIFAAMALGTLTARADVPVPAAQLEVFLGLNPGRGLSTGDLTNLGNGPVTSGSGIVRTLSVQAGDTLTFDFNFLTNAPPIESRPLAAVDPFAFVTAPTLATIADNGFNFPPPMTAAPGATGYALQTGYRSQTITFTTAGPINIGFGVANVTTDEYGSALLLSNAILTSGGSSTNFFGAGGFGGFAAIGQASIVTSGFGIAPPSGTYQVLLQAGSVPEPSSCLLLALGGVGAAAGFVVRGRRRSQDPAGRIGLTAK